jgi:hypothetical protein
VAIFRHMFNPLNKVTMSFRCTLPAQVDKGLDLLSAAYGLSKQDMVRELVIVAVADNPEIRQAVITDFKAKLAKHAALTGEKIEA